MGDVTGIFLNQRVPYMMYIHCGKFHYFSSSQNGGGGGKASIEPEHE